nr:MAG TPA: hypothetical protein [Inoviridae sp.]
MEVYYVINFRVVVEGILMKQDKKWELVLYPDSDFGGLLCY